MPSSTTNSPLVSCVIIFLNTQEYLEEAIESILTQTYTDWELFLVDDGSTDGSTKIAQRYAQKHPDRIFYLEHEGHQNRGMSASRNLGIKRARGEFIAFLDADDVWLPGKLEEQLSVFKAYPEAGMVYGRTLFWHSWTSRVEEREDYFSPLGVKPDALIKPPKLLITLLEGNSQAPTTCNAIMRKQIIEEVGYFEEAFRGMYEDQVFFAKVLLHVPVFVDDRCWAKYRQHPNSCYNTTIKDLEKACTTRLFFLTWLKNYFQQQDVQNFYIWFLVLKHTAFCQNPRILLYWTNTKNSVMQVGRNYLPASTRDWLWSTVGRHL